MSKKSKVPQLRFSEFTDDWEQRKVDDIAEKVIGGGTPKTGVAEYWDGKIPWIQSSNIQENDMFNFEIPKSITQVGLNNSAAKLIPENSIAVVTHVGVGKLVFVPFSYTTSQDFTSLSDLKTDAKFTCYSLYRRIQNDLHIVQGSAIKGITKEDLLSKEIMVPELEEQRKIGELFFNIDNLITLHQRKLDNLKNIKKSMLQKLFPKKGEKYPEVRFKGFNGDWEQRKLPEFVDFYNGLTYSPDDVREAGTLVLRSSNVKGGEVIDADNVYVSPEKASSENVKDGDIIIVVRNGSRALIGKHAEIKGDKPNTVIGAFMTGIRSKHPSFVNALLDTSQFENEIARNMGATINQITGYMFSKMEFMIPSPKEQDKIGCFFKNLDNLITLHQRKLDNLKNIKKGFLQQMFA